jgi:alpha-L-rhamnosidase
MKTAYNNQFFKADSAQYDNNTVTANILSLRLGLVPAGYEQKVFEQVVRKTVQDFNGHVSTGVVGIQQLMRGLTQYGQVDLAYRIATNETYPSWGYMVSKGATTIWELWNGDTADPSMNSMNHVMLLGDLIPWFYEDLAGIKNAQNGTGYQQIRMEPILPAGLTHVKAAYQSVYGTIQSEWKKEKEAFFWDITIPGNTSAIVKWPAGITFSQEKQKGIKRISRTASGIELELGSGTYRFHN